MKELSKLSINILSIMQNWKFNPPYTYSKSWQGYGVLEFELKGRDFNEFQYTFRGALRNEMKVLLSLGLVEFINIRNPENKDRPNQGYKLTDKGINFKI